MESYPFIFMRRYFIWSFFHNCHVPAAGLSTRDIVLHKTDMVLVPTDIKVHLEVLAFNKLIQY